MKQFEMRTVSLSATEVERLFAMQEGHFLDFKAKEIMPAKITRTISAFGNADGGEVFLGIVEPSSGGAKSWAGFDSVEAANGHIQAISLVLPLGQGCRMSFLSAEGRTGLLLHIEVFKNRDVIRTSSDDVYIRRGAQNLPVS